MNLVPIAIPIPTTAETAKIALKRKKTVYATSLSCAYTVFLSMRIYAVLEKVFKTQLARTEQNLNSHWLLSAFLFPRA